RKPGTFTGLLRETSIEVLAHLGPNAFEEIVGEVVQSAMFVLANHIPSKDHKITAIRLVGIKNADDKKRILQEGKLVKIKGTKSHEMRNEFL
ncbi:MAG TPA: hypothetical protein VKX46_13590, partial [Ktedonobacteraceae bacterium]|nr:hypothetical protein [Ktedonobacteraceae bacterium]